MVRNRWKQAALVTAALNVLVAAGIAAQDKVVHPRAGVAGQWRVIGQVNANLTALQATRSLAARALDIGGRA